MNSDPDFDWKTRSSEDVFDCRVFHISKHVRANARKQGEFFVLSGNDWVNIIPVTKDGEIVMIEQFRHGTSEVTLEIPGGLVDDTDESSLSAARREMNEETGYDSDEIEFLGTIAPNPAIQSNHCHSFLARNVEPKVTMKPDEFEEIRVRLVSLQEIPELIRTGAINHALVVVAFLYFALQHSSEILPVSM